MTTRPAGWRASLPPEGRADVAALDAALGLELGDERLVAALRDPRGLLFQRLEFVGDSVLDAVAVAALTLRSGWSADLGGLTRARQELVSDAALARIAEQRGLPPVRAFAASSHRLADRIEGCIGAAWADLGLGAAAQVTHRLVLDPVLADLSITPPPSPDAVGPAVDSFLAASHRLGHEPVGAVPWLVLAAMAGPGRRGLAVVGDAVLETAAATALYVQHPAADEGELSALRRGWVTNHAMAEVAVSLGLSTEESDRAAADLLQAVVGAISLGSGLPAATQAAAAALGFPFCPGPV